MALNGLLTMVLGIASDRPGCPIWCSSSPRWRYAFSRRGSRRSAWSPRPARRNIAVSMVTPFAFMIGAGAVPALIGWASDLYSFRRRVSDDRRA
ncbi:MAG: hypothetical protein MZV70_11010 [Desulfobacterales bacterium]|nr:hypothetical protein [Desulfobacterales bacterium]